MKYFNLSAYKFVDLDAQTLVLLQNQLKTEALSCDIKGTIILSTEGINLFLAGTVDSTTQFISYITGISAFSDLWFKITESDFVPFKRMVVRVKKEIITMNQPMSHSNSETAPYIEPSQLDEWYKQKKEMILLDTRNDYEYHLGSFENAIHLNISNFSSFPEAISRVPDEWKAIPLVTYCTGGIRCEKASVYMSQLGFKNVWQLKGGILNYLEQSEDNYFRGKCFVFDNRIALPSP